MPVLANAKHERFSQEIAKGTTQRKAYRLAGYTEGSDAAADANGCRLIKHDRVAARVAEIQGKAAVRAEITQELVLRELWAIASADPNELIEYRRCCCRYCWGEGFDYQETRGERDRRLDQWEKDRRAAAGKKNEGDFATFSERGGVGYHAFTDPNPDCPECFGQGEGQAFAKDTRDLSGDAAKLYAGVKVTKDGFELKMHDKAAALVSIGRHLGMFTDKLDVKVEVTLTPEERKRRIDELVAKAAGSADGS